MLTCSLQKHRTKYFSYFYSKNLKRVINYSCLFTNKEISNRHTKKEQSKVIYENQKSQINVQEYVNCQKQFYSPK